MTLPIFRPATEDDLQALTRFAQEAAYGITSLPRDNDALAFKIQRSGDSFQENPKADQLQVYLFCLEWEGRVVGTSGITARIGMEDPFYAYHLLYEQLRYPKLGIDRKTGVLHFTRAHKMPAEIGTLFLSKELRLKDIGKFLSLSRFLFIASFRQRFADTIIAELRGINQKGISPFWDAVGRPFYGIDFPEADLLRTQHGAAIEALFPKHPLYLDLLPQDARSVVGSPHEETRGALKILEKQGFQKSAYVDIFDAGPHLFSPTDAIHAVAASTVATVHELRSPFTAANKAIVSNARIHFRATLASILIEEQGVVLHPDVARTLQVELGDSVRYYLLP